MKTNHKLEKVEKKTDNKYLNYYVLTYDNNGKEFNYFMASRRSEDNLVATNPNNKIADAVRVVPYFYKNGKLYVVLIKEFRYALNKYILSTPAGVVDPGETELTTAKRELKEEIGARVKKIQRITKACYSSAGLSDESISCFEAEVELCEKQSLGNSEDIEIICCEVNKLPTLFKTNEFGLQSRLHLELFYQKHKSCNLERE